MNKKTIVLFFLVLTSGIYYYALTAEEDRELITANVIKVIDGDTLTIENDQKIRLLGINTPESKMLKYEEAKEYLKKLENKTIMVEKRGIDKYGRILAHTFTKNNHINEQILKNGLGHLYYYEKDAYYNNLKKAEEYAREKNIGIWKPSSQKNCISLIELDPIEKTKRCSNEEKLTLLNSCNKDINITIKDDATHIYRETIKANQIFEKNFSCIWNDAGDTLYVHDSEGLLIFYRY